MTSAIVSSTIDADYPVSGQDNDSQGFRDNFSVIKDGLAIANAEITVLQNTSAKLNVDNDFGGNVIDNATTNRLYGSVYSTTSTATTNVSLANGEYQRIQVVGNHTVAFTDWPETDKFAKIRLELKSNGTAQTITFSTEGGGIVRTEITQTLASVTDVNRKASTVATTSAVLSFLTANKLGTFNVGDLVFGTGLLSSATIGAIGAVTGAVTLTTKPTPVPYTSINGLTSTVSCASSSIIPGAKVTLSDVTGISGLSTSTTYYAYDVAAGTGFKLAATYADAIAGTPIITGLRGTISYTAIALNGRVTTAGSSAAGIPVGNKITLSNTDGAGGIDTVTTYYTYNCDSTGFNLAATLLDALSATPITLSAIFTGVGTASHYGQFNGAATATFRELNPSANRVTVSSTTNMYVDMPIKFSGSPINSGGIVPGRQYYITNIIDGSGIRISETKQGEPVTLTDTSPAPPPSLTINDTTVLTVFCSSQVITPATGLTITTSDGIFPYPFQVSNDVNKIRIVEAWTSDGGTNIFLKYIGEFA